MGAHFLTFADRRFRVSIDRLVRQAERMGAFDTIHGATEHDLDPSFRKQFAARLRPGVRGFGYWVWKPQMISQTLNRMPEDDVLLYSDAGSHLNPAGRERLIEYFEATGGGPPILAFELGAQHTIRRWTKGDLLQHFGLTPKHPITSTPQVAAGVLIMRNCPAAREFVGDWRRVFDHWNLVDDSPSESANHPDFVEHRHDQSVLSLLAHTRPLHIWNHDEQYPPCDSTGALDWVALSHFPVHTRRDLQTDRWHLRIREWLRLRRLRLWIGLRGRDLRLALARIRRR